MVGSKRWLNISICFCQPDMLGTANVQQTTLKGFKKPFFYGFSTVHFQMSLHTHHTSCVVWLFPLCVFKCALKLTVLVLYKIAMVPFDGVFSTVCFQVCSQIDCPSLCKIALATIFFPFLHYALSKVSSNCLHKEWQTNNSCIIPLCVLKCFLKL